MSQEKECNEPVDSARLAKWAISAAWLRDFGSYVLLSILCFSLFELELAPHWLLLFGGIWFLLYASSLLLEWRYFEKSLKPSFSRNILIFSFIFSAVWTVSIFFQNIIWGSILTLLLTNVIIPALALEAFSARARIYLIASGLCRLAAFAILVSAFFALKFVTTTFLMQF